jgi:TRAP-type C4-dicarboxylate transport system permease small subunit
VAIAAPTAALVLIEVFVLLGGVISRYVFHHPIIWSDELASTLLWLAMLGSAVAMHRSEHMRMTAFVGVLSPPVRLVLDTVATVAALTFLLLILPSAYDFATDEIPVTTPAMQISDAWRAAALPFGFTIMIAVGLIRLLSVGNWLQVVADSDDDGDESNSKNIIIYKCSNIIKYNILNLLGLLGLSAEFLAISVRIPN